MARSTRMSVLKRQREQKKAEKAAMKRERREPTPSDGPKGDVASRSDLAAYGAIQAPFDDEDPA